MVVGLQRTCACASSKPVSISSFSPSVRSGRRSICLHAVPPNTSTTQAEANPSVYRRTGVALLSALVVLSGPPPLPGAFLSHLTNSPDASQNTNISTTRSSSSKAGGYGLAVAAGSPNPAVIEGIARVSDGDTLVIGKERIRLYGMDAPEKAQPCKDAGGHEYACGLVSKKALEEKVGSQPLRCEVKTVDQYGRNVASCSIAGNLLSGPQDLGQFMVSNGLAVAYRQYGKEYIPLEESAHAAHKGIWAGSFTIPSEWRKAQKAASLGVQVATTSIATNAATTNASALASAVDAASIPSSLLSAAKAMLPGNSGGNSSSSSGSGACAGGAPALIKGNIGSKGDKIYHSPGGKSYDSVKIDTAAGERYFCTEAEAQAAGFRAAKA